MLGNFSIILFQPYPNGMACTNRIHLYAKGMQHLGVQSVIYIPRYTEYNEKSAKNTKSYGSYDGVKYEYTCGKTIRSKSFLGRRFSNIKGLAIAAYRIYCNRKNTEVILMVDNSLFPILVFYVLAAMLRKKYILEKSEFPFYNKIPDSFLSGLYQSMYKKHVYKMFDGIIVISKPLKEYFIKIIGKNAKLLEIPVIMDSEKFSDVKIQSRGKYIAYCGNFTQEQDGIISIIRAFVSVSKEVANLKLVLIGEPIRSTMKKEIECLVNEFGLSDKVNWLGFVSKEDLISYLVSAKALVLAKPKSLQADYCFPSKLAEYLASGAPVVATKVGVIPEFLTDGENAFLAEPDNVDSLAKKLLDAANGGNASKSIGSAGKALAMDKFDYFKQSERIVKFIDSIDS